ncbi:Sin3p binding protein [Histoplasma capsulatum]|uniref:Sin3p binding protein n=1 Tax=Ajellomyces capsulatus TaxID=5037 RepID=A0A8A1M4R6_AJECA|nr:Sin3p binding protein [Histoplasma capsulatum]
MAYPSDPSAFSPQAVSPRPDERSVGRGYSTPPHTEVKCDSPKQGHQRFVFTDPVAFRYLEEDPSTIVLDRRRTLTGYEIYIVEQWACSRVHPTFVINTYTGDPSNTAIVAVLSIPTDENAWSPRLKVYFDAVAQFHSRKRETPLGILMVTNLSSFPSALTVILVPHGDVKRHREDFVVNENLKRLGCSGRAGMNLKQPSAATQAKFHQLYRTSERVPLYSAVMELVKQCQMALMIFDKLAPEYADGLLCDVTEKAINDWWTDIGTDFFNIEPSDGILGPTTVSALLGTVMGARNRLHAYGAPVSKDVFDVATLKRGIESFQKSQKLDRTRRLDRQTLDRLHRVTTKVASGDGWNVPRAVKSTVAELGGKGGEMVIGMVAGRAKAGIAEIETIDMDRFVQLVSGERPKWLWHGKPRKTGSDIFRHATGDDSMVFTNDDRGGYKWTSRKRDAASDQTSGRHSLETECSGRPIEFPGTFLDDREPQLKGAIKRSVTGKVSDARAGFGRFRDAVGLPADGGPLSNDEHSTTSESEPSEEAEVSAGEEKTALENVDALPEAKGATLPSNIPLRRPRSHCILPTESLEDQRNCRWPRHLSFSAVEDTILCWENITDWAARPDTKKMAPADAMLWEDIFASDVQYYGCKIQALRSAIAPWVEKQVSAVEFIDIRAQARLDELNTVYHEKIEDFRALQVHTTDLVAVEGSALMESSKKVELLGAKLDYELNALQLRIEEVEVGLNDYERHIVGIENRVRDLVKDETQKAKESWFSWGSGLLGR